jgi:hypothetical protein
MKDSLKQRLAMTTGAAAAAFGPAAVQGAVVYNNTGPITATFNPSASQDWDVDGDGNTDFSLNPTQSYFQSYKRTYSDGLGGTYTSPARAFAFATVRLIDGGRNGRGLVRDNANADDFKALAAGFAVGPTLGSGYNWGGQNSFREVVFAATNKIGYFSAAAMYGYLSAAIDPDFRGGEFGDNFIGFRFDISGATHYGWAELFVDDGTGSGGRGDVTITRWAYESTADCGLQVGQTSGDNCPPDPSTIPNPGTLALLAAGAAGLRRWRGKADAA